MGKYLSPEREAERRRRTGQALPEPRKVKRRILWADDDAQDKILDVINTSGFHNKQYYEVRESVGKLFMTLYSFARRFKKKEEYQNLLELKDEFKKQRLEPTSDNLNTYIDYYYKLNDLMYDLGITKIGIETDDTSYGYEFLSGLEFDMSTQYANFRRLLENIRNMAHMLKQDTDFMIALVGGKRLGKTTLGLQLLKAANEANDVGYGRDNLILNEEDFWSASDDNPQYSTNLIDEGGRLLYSKDAMTKSSKNIKKKLKTYATRNQGLLTCFHEWSDLDKEVKRVDVKATIRLPKRGRFEFYSKQRMKNVEYDKDDGRTKWPEPTFAGNFPDYNGGLWDIYKEHESDKHQGIRESDGTDSTVKNVIKQIEDRMDYFTKEWGDRTIINKSLVISEIGCSHNVAKSAKAKVEAEHDELG